MAVDTSFDVFVPASFQDGSITLTDYGCSEGRNSVKLIEQYLSRISGVSSATLIFNDTPFNDFSSLSSTIEKNRLALSQGGKVRIYPQLSPQSFYQQVVPDESVDAGFCFTALHWLRNMPTSPDLSLLSAAAHTDLVDFLSARHKELRQDGHLMLCIPIQGPVNVTFAVQCMKDAVRTLADVYAVDPSSLTNLPLYWRTIDEITASVTASDGNWEVLQSVEVPMEHPAASLLRSDFGSDIQSAEKSRDEYAKVITDFVLVALLRFVLDDFRATRRKQPADGITEEDLALEVAKLQQELHTEIKNQILRTYGQEKTGFTYAYVQLKKV